MAAGQCGWSPYHSAAQTYQTQIPLLLPLDPDESPLEPLQQPLFDDGFRAGLGLAMSRADASRISLVRRCVYYSAPAWEGVGPCGGECVGVSCDRNPVTAQ